MTRFLRRLSFVLVTMLAASLHAQTTTTPTTTTPTTTTPTGTTTTTTPSNTGVLIYKMSFGHIAGFNIDFWKSGYLVVPGVGGTGTVVLAGRNDFGTLIYNEFDSSAWFFQAKRKNTKYSVVQMTGGTIGTTLPLVGMQAFGEIHDTIVIDSPNFSLRVQAATTLHGVALASLDESLIPATITTGGTAATTDPTTGVTTPATSATTVPNPARPTDGTLGYADVAEMKLTLDTSKTNDANKNGRGVADAVAKNVVAELVLQGYTSSAGTGTTTGGGGTTTTPSGGNGNGGTTTP